MRDILTVIASIVILILAAAVAAPPLINWESYRGTVDGLIARAANTEVRTEGSIGIRLLPSPRIKLDRLRLGSAAAAHPTLTADYVTAEIALTPLLRGEVRFTETRIGRAEVRVPVAADGDWRIPQELLSGSGRAREWAIENLSIGQFLLTTQMSTGRTDQFYAENVSVEGQKLIGPWRVEGITAGVPFRFTTGELAPDKTILAKLTGGGDIYPRFEIDARLGLDEGTGNTAVPIASGKARLLFGPPAQVAAAGIPIPIAIETDFKTGEGAIAMSPFTLEAGEGGASLRLTGEGTIGLNEPRISLKLEGKRLDADSFILSSNGQDFKSRLAQWTIPQARIPVDLDLKIDSIGLGQEDLGNAILHVSLDKDRLKLSRIDFMAPGETRVALEGQVGLKTQGSVSGRVAIASNVSDRFARYLQRLNIRSPFLNVLDGRPFEAASDISYASPVLSLSRLHVKTGDAVITGNLRYTEAEAKARGKLEAQVGIQGLNLDQLPHVSSVFDATQNLDVGFILDARDVRSGNRPGAGRISARILSDGPALLVEALNITDLAGANASVSGRIAPDGTGRIAGKVTAQRAAPVVDLLGSVWIGGASKLLPAFLREGALNLDVVTERVTAAQGQNQLRLRTTAKGQAAGGTFDSQVESVDGKTQALNARLMTQNTGNWVSRTKVVSLDKPSDIQLRGTRVGSGQFNVTLEGELGGVQVKTNRPFTLSAGDDIIDSGEADLNTADVTPFLALIGDGSGVAGPLPAQARITLGREADATLLDINGRVANNPLQGKLTVRSRSELSGEVSVERLSLPWVVTALALNGPPDPSANAIWSTAHFGQSNRTFTGGQILVRAKALDFGRGLVGTSAKFNLSATPDGIAIGGLEAGFGTGKLTGSTTITRQGALASVVGEGTLSEVPLFSLVGATPFSARLSGALKFGSAGESVSELVANLGGAGDWRITDLRVPSVDPSAFDRGFKRVLAESEPLAEGKAETILGEELGRGQLTATSVITNAALVGGALRLSPFIVDSRQASWQGAVGYDLKSLSLDARGSYVAKGNFPGWTGAPPSIGLGWRGSLAAPVREIDAGPFRNGLAAIVLKRELEKIEAFERAAAERQKQIEVEAERRRKAAEEAERQRRAAEEAERQRKAAEEADRQSRLREEADRARIDAERIQSQQQNASPAGTQGNGGSPPPFTMPPLTPPVELTPPPRVQTSPGG